MLDGLAEIVQEQRPERRAQTTGHLGDLGVGLGPVQQRAPTGGGATLAMVVFCDRAGAVFFAVAVFFGLLAEPEPLIRIRWPTWIV